MIIAQIKAGLGNQLFQYAAAKQLAEKLGTQLKLNVDFFDNNMNDVTQRNFELNKLAISAPLASKEEIKRIKKKTWKNIFHISTIRERHYPLLHLLLRRDNNYYVKGYWQSERYFADITPIIRDEFRFMEPLQEEYFKRIQQKIRGTNSVSLHFRRGDYVTNPKVNACFGSCTIEYYQKAIKIISSTIPDPRLFIFSDDITWVKDNFSTRLPTIFIDQKDEMLHSDFRLMQLCQHNIIANSSYSWWAAWLNENPSKIVIAPQQWSKDKQLQHRSATMIPRSWMRV